MASHSLALNPPAERGSRIFGKIVVIKSATSKYIKYLLYDKDAFQIIEEVDKIISGPGKIS